MLETLFLSFGLFLSYIAFKESDVRALLGAVISFFVFSFFFLYGRPPSITVFDDGISFSLFGFKMQLPYAAMHVYVTDTSRSLGWGVDRITASSAIVPLAWIYWLVLAGGLVIFGAITYKEGFSEPVLRGSLIFVVAGFASLYLLQIMMRKLLSLRIIDAELRIFINSKHTDALDKFPFQYYKTRFFHYRLGFISELNSSELRYLIEVFKEKLEGEQLHIDEVVLKRYLNAV